MEQMTVTAKIQISVNADSKVYLIKPCLFILMPAILCLTMCSALHGSLKQFSLNKVLCTLHFERSSG